MSNTNPNFQKITQLRNYLEKKRKENMALVQQLEPFEKFRLTALEIMEDRENQPRTTIDIRRDLEDKTYIVNEASKRKSKTKKQKSSNSRKSSRSASGSSSRIESEDSKSIPSSDASDNYAKPSLNSTESSSRESTPMPDKTILSPKSKLLIQTCPESIRLKYLQLLAQLGKN
ncbi:hypothetical protein TVAG_401700 [Trichomonas vaginalis G3]|uniref:Uncharacterized protein n=1 Tax=Trichomonas vaginalis (strain ATCC PRA-98 / G3) TaxID=412133 RepID=A2EGD6_TRIV3|nr:hypothetical protein TVAGG3_0130820 [Trichomonas vaginalis G3]EAY08315.1 hypothetical protein TVAG_401700 [Trichomonas vaginalis G3]KAI5546084.1 hypothetical protein TVAGG3_0130820 [Trichomonas vaginalis G3]|eukprot:XP_001320538.1 hypothetical protein [Trichomonas vaginalis G3]